MTLMRWLKKAHPASDSTLSVLIPFQVKDRWQLQKGDPLTLYEADDLLIVLPASQWNNRKAQRLLRYLQEYQEPEAP